MKSERIEPMPEELASAHEGRMALFIGARDHQEFDRWLKQKLARTAPDQVGMSRVAQLAAACEMSAVDYARQHSLLGVLRAVARTHSLGPHGAPQGEAFTRRMGMVNQKSAAYLCLHCVEEDLNHWKFSWFRRTHHLQGVDWCPSHKTPLVKVVARDPWSKLPQHWVESGSIEPETQCNSRKDITPFEERFSDIACTLLRNNGPFEVDTIREILVARAEQFGLRTCANGKRPLVSDIVLKRAPKPWLDQHWPEMRNKSAGTFLNAIDKGVSQRNIGISGFGYTTILAALWETSKDSDHVLRELGQNVPLKPTRERKVVSKRGEAYWQGEIWNSYLENEGRASGMANQLGVNSKTVRLRMGQIGLPGLCDVGDSPKWRAFLRFESGEDLIEACAAEHVQLSEVMLLVKLSCARVATAARIVLAARQVDQPAASTKKSRLPNSTLKTQTKGHRAKVVS